jgi:molecular chaperone GrpE (heat shock protein)
MGPRRGEIIQSVRSRGWKIEGRVVKKSKVLVL